MSTLNPLQTGIIRTLAYYDTFDYPLTTKEIWRWFFPAEPIGPVTPDEIELHLRQEPLAAMTERQGDFVVLRGRKQLIPLRAERAVRNTKKWRRVMTVARYVELVPFIKMIAVVNTLAIDNARPESDIDLLVVTAPGHIWLTRMAITGIVSMLGYRRHGDKIQDRVCLSFYVTTAAMNFEELKRADDDPHFAFWTSQAVPVLDDKTYEKFVETNGWVKALMPNAWAWDWKERLIKPNASLQSIKNFYQTFFQSPIGASLEMWARNRQLKKMEGNTTSRSKEPTTDVIISEDVLKFHERDRRLEYRQRWYDRLKSLGL